MALSKLAVRTQVLSPRTGEGRRFQRQKRDDPPPTNISFSHKDRPSNMSKSDVKPAAVPPQKVGKTPATLTE